MISLHLLGPFRLTIDGRPCRLPTRKAQSLLAYLVLYPHAHAREKLAALLWGDAPAARAAGSLRTALTHLRTVLGESALLSDRLSVQLNPNLPLWADVRALAEGAAIPSGDLLDDVYDDWVLPLREHYRQRRVELLLQQAQALRGQSEYERAIAVARQVLALDPGSERAYQHLIFCFLGAGDRAAALSEYERCRQVLSDVFAVEPLPETTALYEWIKQAEVPSSASLAALRTNLPLPLSSFVGRREATAALNQRLQAADSRLITLVGPGGSGKTRLAIQVAADLVDAFPAGVWWVDFTALAEPEQVALAVARALGVRAGPNQPLLDALVDHLRERRLLLVLDNCEHLVGACVELSQRLLAACAQLQLLATSREALQLTGEVHWPVPPLALPAAQPPLPALAEVESVRLFVERAQAVQSDFVLAEDNASAVRDICLRLDGIPLALELAAARVRVLSPQQIAGRLDERLGLLTTGSRGVLPRHQTLRAALDWSHDLLSAEEQVLFRRLAVFAGGFDLAAAQAVAWAGESGEVLAPLARLVHKSLVVAVTSRPQARYRLLETVREYAGERLQQAGELELTRDRHLACFLTLATTLEPDLVGPNQSDLLDRLETEQGNLRAALDYAAAAPGRTEQGLALSGQLGRFWWTRGYYHEARERLERFLAQTPANAVTFTRAKALHALGNICQFQGDFAQAPVHFQAAELLYRAIGDNYGIGSTLVGQAIAAHELDQNDLALSLLEASLPFYRAIDDKVGLGVSLTNLGHVALEQGDYARARPYLEQAIGLYRAAGNRQSLAYALYNLGQVARFEGNFADARAYHDQALALRRGLDDRGRIAWSLCALGEVAYEQDDLAAARQLLEESAALFRPLGDRNGLAQALVRLGYVWLRLEDEAHAIAPLIEAARHYQAMGRRRGVANALSALAVAAAALGQPERSARLLGGVGALLVMLGATLPIRDQQLHEQAMALARSQSPPAVFEAAWRDGERLAASDGTALVAYAEDVFG